MYEEFFGLSDSPFRLTPDPRFLYLSSKHAEALAHLRLGLTEPGGFVCITGEIGTGKTTVLRTFLADLGPDVATAFIFNPTLSWDELLQRIARELGVPVGATSHGDVMDALNAHLLATRKDGRISVVVIDEAQAMSLEVLERLRLLSNLETSTEKLVRLVLVGQPQLARILTDPALAQLNQRITLRWHLRALTRRETFMYVRHRLTVAGGPEAARLFTVPALYLVYRYAAGVPRLVNMIAHRATLAAYVRRRRRVGARAVRAVYREIGAVPLHQARPARRLGWFIGATIACAALAVVGAPRVVELVASMARPSAPVSVSLATVASVGAVDAKSESAATASAASAASGDLERRLTRITPERSLRDAVGVLLAAWHVAALDPNEDATPASLEALVHRRGLEDLRLTGNLSMLRLLDLPAVLEIRLPGMRESSYVALGAVDDGAAIVTADGENIRVAPAELDQVWFGDAHVIWRDFEWLGPTFGSDAHGEHVARLQRLLTQAGVYTGAASGTFDAATQAAVLGFQRSRRLDPDCRIGRLTRIALYGAAGGYKIPTLAGSARGHDSAVTASGERGAS